MSPRWLPLAVLLAASGEARAQASCTGADAGCSCQGTTSCRCAGGCALGCGLGTCSLAADGGATVQCREGSRCTVNVGGALALTCNEATSCTATGGLGSTVACLGDRSCSVTVAGGSVQCRNELGTTCQVTCLGSCAVTCAGRGTCPQTCLGGPLVRCGNDLSTCGLCPDGGAGLGADAGPDVPLTPWNLTVGCTSGPGVAPWVLLAVALAAAAVRRSRRR